VAYFEISSYFSYRAEENNDKPGLPEALSLGVKRPEREAYYSPPSSAEVKNARSYRSTLQYVFMAWCLVKHCMRLDGLVLS